MKDYTDHVVKNCDGDNTVTLVRKRTVYEEKVVSRKEYEELNKKLNEYGNEWWVGLEKDNPKLMDKLSFYDQLVSTVGRGFVCAKCQWKIEKIGSHKLKGLDGSDPLKLR